MMGNVKDRMECIGLKWNEKKCAVIHVKQGSMVSDAEDLWPETHELSVRGFKLQIPWGAKERETGGRISIGVSSQGILEKGFSHLV